jgi:hypothetical protein
MLKGLFLLLAVCYAQHDHTQHLDTTFIVGEARRVGWLKLDEILRTLEDYISALRLIERKYEESFANPDPADKERLDEIWKEHFEPKYHDTHDRVFIISHVCLDVYSEPKCNLPEDIWNDKIDRRGLKFRDEFIIEVHSAI